MDLLLAFIGLAMAVLILLKVDRLFQHRRADAEAIADLAEKNLSECDIIAYRKRLREEEHRRVMRENLSRTAPVSLASRTSRGSRPTVSQTRRSDDIDDDGIDIPWSLSGKSARDTCDRGEGRSDSYNNQSCTDD